MATITQTLLLETLKFNYMTRDEIIDFLEWAQDCGQLQFPESRKVDMAEMYIKEQDAVNKTCNIPHVSDTVCPKCNGQSNGYIHGFRTYCDRCGGTGQTGR